MKILIVARVIGWLWGICRGLLDGWDINETLVKYIMNSKHIERVKLYFLNSKTFLTKNEVILKIVKNYEI